MPRLKSFCLAVAILIALSIVSGVAAQSSQPTPVRISGVVQSFSGNTLDIKPAASPAVWVMVPWALPVDRGSLKQGANVSVQARWDDLCYIATEVTITK